MSDRIKIVQIGCMHEHASGKMKTMKKLGDIYDLVGYVDDTLTATTPKHPNDQSVFEGVRKLTLDEALSVPGLQAALVEVPNNELVPMTLRCLDRGLAVHMDKPAGEDLVLYKKLLDGYKAKNLPFQMGYMFRGNKAFQFTINAIRSKLIGETFWIESDMNHSYGGDAYLEYISGFPGGLMYNLGCHLIDFILAAMGEPEKIQSCLGTAPGSIPGSKTNCATILEYPGCMAGIRICCRDPRWMRSVLVLGTKGSISFTPQERFDGESIELELRLTEPSGGYPAGVHTLRFPPQTDRYEEQLRELADVIHGKCKSTYSFEHDYSVHAVTLAAAKYVAWDDVKGRA